MKNSDGDIIYIGKAKALKNRVSSYFGSHRNHTLKVIKMVENVEDFDYIITGSESEALVLECSLIKQNQPKYNILLKDDKGFHYVKITCGDWPKIEAAHRVDDDGAKYLGPYTSSFAVSQTVGQARDIFRLPRCSRNLDGGKYQRPCLNYYIKLCSAPCAGKISKEEYNKSVREALDYISSGSDKAVEEMRREMERLSENLEFEKAAVLRDRINAISRFTEKQKVVSADIPEQDVFALARSENKCCVAVLRFQSARLCDTDHFMIDLPEDTEAARYEIITRYYSIRDRVPARISLDGPVADEELLSQWLSEKSGKKVSFAYPQRGEQKKILEMCRENAAEKLAVSLGRRGSETAALDELASLLGLKNPPEYIESYDISHTAGSENVAGMIVFKNGKPLKKAYKHFKIKGFEGQDDTASMAEVLERRFTHYKNQDGDEGFNRLPDLILLDGALGQVHAVKAVMERMGIDVPLFGMVKDSHHRTRAVTGDGGEISISAKRQAFTLVSEIQEEVHRFAITYHRKRREGNISTSLTQIPGIGQKRAQALLKHFRSIKKIASAEIEELTQAEGINEKAAKAVYDYYHGD